MNLQRLKPYQRIFFWTITVILFVIFADKFYLHLMYGFGSKITDETKLLLLEKSDDPKHLTLFENEQVTISIGYDQYTDYLNSDRKGTDSYRYIESCYGEIELAFRRGDIPKGFQPQYTLIIEMLESGQATVYDKQKNKDITLVVERYIDYSCGPICGGASLKFYSLSGKLIFESGGMY